MGNNQVVRFFLVIGVLFWLFFFKAIDVQAQRQFTYPALTVENVGADQGFTQNSIFDIKQDSRGYIWIATPNGLFEFDGYSFRVIDNDPNADLNIAHNEVIKIEEDREGRLWILNRKGINCYVREQNKTIQYPLRELRAVTLVSMMPDRQVPNKVWLCTPENIGYIIINPETFSVEKIVYPLTNIVTNNKNQLRSIYQNSEGLIWLTKGNHLYKYSPESDDLVESENQIYVTDLLEDGFGRLYASYRKGLTRIKKTEDGEFELGTSETIIQLEPSIIEKGIQSLFLTKTGSIGFVVLGEGLGELNNIGEFDIFYNVFDQEDRFEHSVFHTSFLDNTGVLWLGTFREGLFKSQLKEKPFVTVTKEAYDKPGLTDNSVNQISGDDQGHIWASTYYGGVNHIQIDDRTVSFFDSFNSDIGMDPNGISFGLLYDDSETLWVGEPSGGVKRIWFDKNQKPVRHQVYNTNTIPLLKMGKVSTIDQDSLGVIWLGGNQGEGVIRIDKAPDGSLKFSSFDESLNQESINRVFRDREGYLWIGVVDKGVFRYKMDKNDQPVDKIHISAREQSKGALSDYNTHSFLQDKKGNIWVSSFGGGLVKIELPKEFNGAYKFNYFRKKDGLSNNAVYSLLMDAKGNIWMSTDNGICAFDPLEESFRKFNVLDGLQNVTFRKWSSWQDANGTMYFGGSNGFTYFHPKDVTPNNYKANIQITECFVSGEKTSTESFVHLKSKEELNKMNLMLNPDQTSISFEFSSMQFDNPDKCLYRYQLEGANQDWVEVSSENRVAYFPLLQDGNYSFKVMSTNSSGVWNDDYLQLNFTIAPYWYESRIAYLFYAILVLGTIYFLFYLQRKREQFKTEIKIEQLEKINLEEINKAKFSFFTNISHELKTPLTIISNVLDSTMSSLANESKGRKENIIIRKSTERMLRLVTQLLDFRKVESGHLPLVLEHADIISFVRELSVLFEIYSESQNIKFDFQSAIKEIKIDFDPDKIEKVLSNLLDNAVKYTAGESEIKIEVNEFKRQSAPSFIREIISVNEEYIKIQISDNGVGLPNGYEELIFDQFYQLKGAESYVKNRDGVGIGLAYSKTLVELHGGYIYAKSGEQSGASFCVLLPIRNQTILNGGQGITDVIEKSRKKYLIESESNEENALKEGLSQFKDVHLLVVEDNDEIRGFLKEYLSSKFKVHIAIHGVDGLEKARKLMPDLIITDVKMPEMDGYQFCEKLKQDDLTNHIPLIMLTANADQEHRLQGLKVGADSYIPKPFKMEHLLIRIEKLLELRHKLKSKYLSLAGSTDGNIEEADLREEDKKFIEDLQGLIDQNINEADFSVTVMEESMGLSRMQLYRKIRSITGLNSVEFVRHYRIKKAIDLMHSSNMRLSEIIYSLGFNSPSYFGKCFKGIYGKTPKQFMNEARSIRTTHTQEKSSKSK
ncbi:MAG: response regulator [Reichenbachiella sp.]